MQEKGSQESKQDGLLDRRMPAGMKVMAVFLLLPLALEILWGVWLYSQTVSLRELAEGMQTHWEHATKAMISQRASAADADSQLRTGAGPESSGVSRRNLFLSMIQGNNFPKSH